MTDSDPENNGKISRRMVARKAVSMVSSGGLKLLEGFTKFMAFMFVLALAIFLLIKGVEGILWIIDQVIRVLQSVTGVDGSTAFAIFSVGVTVIMLLLFLWLVAKERVKREVAAGD